MTDIKQQTLFDGTPAAILTQAQVDALLEIIEERLFWHGARKRFKDVSQFATLGAAMLLGLSLWWPWIDRVVRLILTGISE